MDLHYFVLSSTLFSISLQLVHDLFQSSSPFISCNLSISNILHLSQPSIYYLTPTPSTLHLLFNSHPFHPIPISIPPPKMDLITKPLILALEGPCSAALRRPREQEACEQVWRESEARRQKQAWPEYEAEQHEWREYKVREREWRKLEKREREWRRNAEGKRDWRQYAAVIREIQEYVARAEEGREPLIRLFCEEAQGVLANAATIPPCVSKNSSSFPPPPLTLPLFNLPSPVIIISNHKKHPQFQSLLSAPSSIQPAESQTQSAAPVESAQSASASSQQRPRRSSAPGVTPNRLA